MLYRADHGGADLTSKGERVALSTDRAWQRYSAISYRAELVELGILPADSSAASEPSEE